LRNKKIIVMALLSASVIILQLLSGLVSSMLPFSISLVLIPVSIAAWYYGVKGGLIVGGTFGVIVFLQCLFGLDKGGATMIYQWNQPIETAAVTIGRALLLGLALGLLSKFKTKFKPYKYIYAAFAPIINTTLFVAMYAVLFNSHFLEAASTADNILSFIIIGFVGINFLIELAVNLVILPPVLKALSKSIR